MSHTAPPVVSLQAHIHQHRKQIEPNKSAIAQKQNLIKTLQFQISQCKERYQCRLKYDLEEQVKQLQAEIENMTSGAAVQEFDERVKPFLQEQERCKDIFRIEDRIGKRHNSAMQASGAMHGENSSAATIGSTTASGSHDSSTNAAAGEKGSGGGLMSFMRKKARTDLLLNADDASGTRTRVVDDYMMIVHNKAAPVHLQAEDTCPECREPMLLESEQSILACPKCGFSKKYMDATSNAMAYGEEVEFAAYSYQRTNYFNEYLTMFQAKETSQVSQKDIDIIMQALYEERFTDPSKIPFEKVRDIVRKKRMENLYKQITQIWCRITGQPPPRLTAQQEEQCRRMFREIQAPYEKHCPPNRKNFFSYSYCMYKFMELLGYTQFLKHFTLLKDRPKLEIIDGIWKKICADLNWEFRESPKEL